MARFDIKPNGEVVLILSASEARGLEICARAGHMHIRTAGISIGNKVQDTAALRAIMALHAATDKIKPNAKDDNERSTCE